MERYSSKILRGMKLKSLICLTTLMCIELEYDVGFTTHEGHQDIIGLNLTNLFAYKQYNIITNNSDQIRI